jgi:hypothetical protein
MIPITPLRPVSIERLWAENLETDGIAHQDHYKLKGDLTYEQ